MIGEWGFVRRDLWIAIRAPWPAIRGNVAHACPPQEGNLVCALSFEFVIRPGGRFILRSRCAGWKGSGQLQPGAVLCAQQTMYAPRGKSKGIDLGVVEGLTTRQFLNVSVWAGLRGLPTAEHPSPRGGFTLAQLFLLRRDGEVPPI